MNFFIFFVATKVLSKLNSTVKNISFLLYRCSKIRSTYSTLSVESWAICPTLRQPFISFRIV